MQLLLLYQGKTCQIRTLPDLQENEKCVVIGTMYKEQELKPTILKQIAVEVSPRTIKYRKNSRPSNQLSAKIYQLTNLCCYRFFHLFLSPVLHFDVLACRRIQCLSQYGLRNLPILAIS